MSTKTYSLVISYNAGGQFCQNVLHYSFDDGGFTNTADAAFALATAWDVTNRAHLLALLNNHVTLLSYKSRALNTPGGFEGILIMGAGVIGSRGGAMSVAGMGPVVNLYPIGNAKQRGRTFLPAVGDLDMDNGIIAPAFKTAFVTHMVLWTQTFTLSGGGAPTATPVVYSRKPLPAISRIIEYARLSDKLGTQRRRQRPA